MRSAPQADEVCFDGLVGPTHHYGGLGLGNLASRAHRHEPSNPKAAALEGLAKTRLVRRLGVRQGVLPPHERPHVPTLRRVGFTGRDADVLERAAREAPALLSACASASAMWAANAATVSPSADATDGRVHLTPANLVSQLHRSIEVSGTRRVLRRIFASPRHFVHHEPLPATFSLADEGAANHLRLGPAHGAPGLEVFVYGRAADDAPGAGPRLHVARQSREASEAVARLHGLRAAVAVRQRPEAIDAGVFHDDVVAVANEALLFFHEEAFAPGELAVLRDAVAVHVVGGVHYVEVPAARVSLGDAVRSYLFNAQLLTLPEGSGMALVCATECAEVEPVRAYLAELASGAGPIRAIHFVDVRQSMRNGGGPACLRLRVVLTPDELAAVAPGVLLDDALDDRLAAWIERHYRDRLTVDELGDPRLLDEGRTALDELTQILGLGALYDFQREPGAPVAAAAPR